MSDTIQRRAYTYQRIYQTQRSSDDKCFKANTFSANFFCHRLDHTTHRESLPKCHSRIYGGIGQTCTRLGRGHARQARNQRPKAGLSTGEPGPLSLMVVAPAAGVKC